MTYSVQIANIAPTTTRDSLHEFFSFCGSIQSIDHHGETATIHFEKSSAAKTALMLNGGTLDGRELAVASDKEHEDDHNVDSSHPFEQSDKPRAGIAAEYLAKGYVLSDNILTRAIKIDSERGISKRFLSYLNSVDQTVGSKTLGPGQTISGKATETISTATQQARAVDEQKGYSKSATDFFHQYYSKALASPLGGKVREFYTTTTKQVLDIHEEAKRISSEHKASTAAPADAPATATATEKEKAA